MSLYIYIYFHHFLRQVEKNLEQTENEKSFILKLPTCRFHYVSMFFQLLSIVQLLRCRKFVQALIEKNLWYTRNIQGIQIVNMTILLKIILRDISIITQSVKIYIYSKDQF